MPRYIDADELKTFAKECWPEDDRRCAIDALIDNAPTADIVPVVRCGECVHRAGEDYEDEFCEPDTTFCKEHEHDVGLDEFCSRGARMEGGKLHEQT